MDQQGLPIVLAYQLGRTRKADWEHVRKAADFIVDEGPKSEQERWENQEGYSPGTIAAEIAGLVCAADIARKNGNASKAAKYEAKADDWQRKRRALDGDPQRPLQPEAVLPAADQGPQARQGHRSTRSATAARRTSTSARSSTCPSSSSSGSASSGPTTR